jgi:hypothetical protein
MIILTTNAKQQAIERGTTLAEITQTSMNGRRKPAKFGSFQFIKTFGFNTDWKGKYYNTKQVEVIAKRIKANWLVITVITKYY